MSERRVTDVNINYADDGTITLDFPIKTGTIHFKFYPGECELELEKCLLTVLRSTPRRFGEMPSNE